MKILGGQMVYPETGERGTAPFYLGEMVTAWKLPPVTRIEAARVAHGWLPDDKAVRHQVQIAEELSKVALAEIIVPVAVYAFKSGVENLSKNNRWPDKGAPEEGEFTNADGQDQ